MKRILERYIAKTIIQSTGMAAFIILGVLILMALLGELKNIGEGDYGIGQAFIYVLLRLPNALYQFSPLLILLGSMIGLSLLSNHRELAVMRASGFSISRITRSVLFAALLLIIVITLLGEWIGPNLSYRAEMRKENAQNAGQAVVTSGGAMWLHVDNNFIHVQQVVGRHLLKGVTRYQFDNKHRMQAAFFAKTLSLDHNEWQMHDVVKTTFYNDRTKSQAFAAAPWDLKLNPNLLNVGLVVPSDLSLPKLAKFIRYLEKNGLQASEYQFDFWQRLFQPLSSVVMIFLAIPFVLGAAHTATLGMRILMGVMVGFAYFILNAFLGQLCIVYQVPAIFAASLPPLGFALWGLFLANRLIRR